MSVDLGLIDLNLLGSCCMQLLYLCREPLQWLRPQIQLCQRFLQTHKLDSLGLLTVIHQTKSLNASKRHPCWNSSFPALLHHFSDEVNKAISLFFIYFNLIGVLWLLYCWKHYLIKRVNVTDWALLAKNTACVLHRAHTSQHTFSRPICNKLFIGLIHWFPFVCILSVWQPALQTVVLLLSASSYHVKVVFEHLPLALLTRC